MGLEKAIKYKKEKRQPYRGSKAFDCTCRNHGTCGWCRENRLHNTKVKEEKMQALIKEFNIL